MVYNTVLTTEKRGPQIAGAQIAGVYCTISVFLKKTVMYEDHTVLREELEP